MRNGFTYNGCHSSQFGVTVKTRSRPIRPEAKRFAIDLPLRDGEYDFSAANALGREMFYERTFTVAISVFADGLEGLQSKLTAISLWLVGSGDLIFDDIPFVVWKGKVSDEIIYMPEHGGKKAVLDVSFRVKPFGSALFGTEGPVLDCDYLKLDSLFPIGLDDIYTFTVKNGGEIHILNFGDRHVRGVINISGCSGNISLALGDKTLSFTAVGSATLDFNAQRAYTPSGEIGVGGEFFELPPGESVIRVGCSSGSTLTVSVSFTPQYMYGGNPFEADWSVNYA